MSQREQKQIQLSQPQPAIDCLAAQFSLSRQKLKLLMQNGAVWLENAQGIHRLRRAKKMLQPGDCLHVYYDEAIQQAQTLPAQLVADEGDYSVWNKPSGMYSQAPAGAITAVFIAMRKAIYNHSVRRLLCIDWIVLPAA